MGTGRKSVPTFLAFVRFLRRKLLCEALDSPGFFSYQEGTPRASWHYGTEGYWFEPSGVYWNDDVVETGECGFRKSSATLC